MELEIISGTQPGPIFVTIYGPIKVGKTLFATYATNPIFLTFERKDVKTVDHPKILALQTIDKVCRTIDQIGKDGGYDWLVFDNVTMLEELARSEVIARAPGATSIADLSHGQGYTQLTDTVVSVIKRLERLVNRYDMSVLLLGHETIVRGKDVDLNEQTEEIGVRLRKDTAEYLGVVSSIMAHLSFETKLITSEKRFGDDERIAKRTETRVLTLNPGKAIRGGSNMGGLPNEMEFKSPDDYAVFFELIEANINGDDTKRAGRTGRGSRQEKSTRRTGSRRTRTS